MYLVRDISHTLRDIKCECPKIYKSITFMYLENDLERMYLELFLIHFQITYLFLHFLGITGCLALTLLGIPRCGTAVIYVF